jgi:hypothetical protein
MSDTVIVAIIAATPGILTLIQQIVSNQHIKEVKEQTNGLTSALVAATATASRAQGVRDEKVRAADAAEATGVNSSVK